MRFHMFAPLPFLRFWEDFYSLKYYNGDLTDFCTSKFSLLSHYGFTVKLCYCILEQIGRVQTRKKAQKERYVHAESRLREISKDGWMALELGKKKHARYGILAKNQAKNTQIIFAITSWLCIMAFQTLFSFHSKVKCSLFSLV